MSSEASGSRYSENAQAMSSEELVYCRTNRGSRIEKSTVMNEACDITVAFEDVGEGEEGEEELDDDSHKECATPSKSRNTF